MDKKLLNKLVKKIVPILHDPFRDELLKAVKEHNLDNVESSTLRYETQMALCAMINTVNFHEFEKMVDGEDINDEQHDE